MRGLAALSCRTVLATSTAATASEEFRRHIGPLADRVDVLKLPGFSLHADGRAVKMGGHTGVWAGYHGLVEAIRQVRPRQVYVPHGNQLARFASLPLDVGRLLRRFDAEAETMITGGRYTLPAVSLRQRVASAVYLRMLARGPWTTLFHLDSVAAEHLRSRGGRLAQITKHSPEPAAASSLTKQQARRRLQLPEAGPLTVVPGLISLRKGVGELAEALRSLPADHRLLLAGKCDPAARAAIDARCSDLLRQGRLLAPDRYLSEEELLASIRAADVVSAYYPEHRYSSSIVVAGAAAGVPLLASPGGWIGRTVRDNDLGVVVAGNGPGSVAEGLQRAFLLAGDYRPSPRGREFARFNSEANFAAAWTARLRERFGLALPRNALAEDAAPPRDAAA